MSIAENKARYEESSLKGLFEASGHVICDRCYCCDSISESSPCYLCGGFEDEDDEWNDVCSACGGEGELYYMTCAGSCDQNGEHKKLAGEPPREGKEPR
jgi:hypothetical protein